MRALNPELKKHEKNISNKENQIVSIYGRSMTTRDISSHIEEIYVFGISESIGKLYNEIEQIIKKVTHVDKTLIE